MKRACDVAVALLALFAGTVSIGQLRGQEDVWVVPERMVPVPAAASDELQNLLRTTAPPDVEAASQFSPEDVSEWIALGEQVDTQHAIEAGELARKFSVEVKLDEIAGVTVHYVMPSQVAREHRGHLFIHLHGGAYVYGKGEAGMPEAVLIAHYAKIPVVSIDYRMPPQHPFPAAVNDVVNVYRHLLQERPAASMALGGTSAGGGLTMATIHKLIALGLARPAALFAGTPWVDLTRTGDTHFTNEGIDHILVTYDGLLDHAAELYAGRHDMKNPLISPIYGDVSGFPPTYLVSGTRDLFLSDTVRMHRKLRVSGIDAELNVYEGMSHAQYAFSEDMPESQQVYRELGTFLSIQLQSLPQSDN